ncbi:Cof-type HAD-IIB family hydrolase [Actinobacillus equuli]|uniref:Cof-type HAD-IIB family hydrolase n=1 Tax=Actinobacillus equuli TaxID=718 RepID=UPI00244252C7|nr:Cof-type HAD-IIB family hydrolase [Actinobacillus equuli]WGE66350.1 Cof-type HAD-IIB family hydrolase [Actinobacillus equuli subsp. equuli]WGE80275.1 Cof-type HAD-IIB family hydrolase [Actinobacillus equuli subsp. equuli]
MNQPFKAIVSDLDGTLLNAEHKIGHFTIETLSKLAAQGIDIFLATGRNLPDVKHIINKVDLKEAMLITSNGARANFLSGETVLNHYIPEEIALQLMQTPFDPTRVCLNTYQGDDWFINVDIEQLKKYHKDSGFTYQVVDFSKHHGKQTEKVFFIGKTPEDLIPIETYIRQQFGDQLYITYSGILCLEIMHKSVCKANALEELVKLRGYTLEDCLAFGDGMNDVEMLSRVGKGCIMENADPRLKQALQNNEVIGNHKEEAVANYLRSTFGII